MPNKVFVVGVGMTKFEKPGRREGWDYPDMARESGTNALQDAGIDYSEVEQGFVGYCSGDSTSGNRALYELGMAPKTANPHWADTSRRWPRSTSSRFPSRRGCSARPAVST
jgi:acetyl-CoA acetyltransferase